MTRTEKIKKLSNAVKRYRGSYRSNDKVWIRRPEKAALSSVATCLMRLGIPWTLEQQAKVDGFKTLPEFHAWLAELQDSSKVAEIVE